MFRGLILDGETTLQCCYKLLLSFSSNSPTLCDSSSFLAGDHLALIRPSLPQIQTTVCTCLDLSNQVEQGEQPAKQG